MKILLGVLGLSSAEVGALHDAGIVAGAHDNPQRPTMKLPNNFYKALAIGAPAPFRELPVRPERVVHFFPPHIEKIRARLSDTAAQVDVLCGNLEDAIPHRCQGSGARRLHRRREERRSR